MPSHKKKGIASENRYSATMKLSIASSFLVAFLGSTTLLSENANAKPIEYYLPAEDLEHEATWLQWPHNYGWDRYHVARYEPSWIQLTQALHTGERVRIFVYNRRERRRVRNVLSSHGIDMSQIDLYIAPTDDVWIRDNGPQFVFDAPPDASSRNTVVEDWGFNGWGEKADFWYDDYIPTDAAYELYLEDTLELVRMVNEGGSIEVDGRGTLMAKKTSILNNNRNPNMSQSEAEGFFRRYFGVTNFIWLEGTISEFDITDDHIDGTARFANGDTIVLHKHEDYLDIEWLDLSEYEVLSEATDVDGQPYKLVHLPLTANVLPGLNYRGIYINYYVANEVVIVPKFNDPNDVEAKNVLQQLYPLKTMVQIDFRELYEDGGLVHCVTMQEPIRS